MKTTLAIVNWKVDGICKGIEAFYRDMVTHTNLYKNTLLDQDEAIASLSAFVC